MKILALTGGVGGAKLAQGLHETLPEGALVCLVNTADDFNYLGLKVCPDLDSVMYALAGESNAQTGWGRAGETWRMRDALAGFGADTWFAIGDLDAATHILRTQALNEGASLTEVTARLAQGLGIHSPIWPMTEDLVATQIHTEAGTISFQDYFVRQQARPEVRQIRFTGIHKARPNARALSLLQETLDLIILCPSNPYLSIDPILQLPGLIDAIEANRAPVIAVTPLIKDRALKGPTGRIMQALGDEVSAFGVARYYAATYPRLLSAFVLDQQDISLAPDIRALDLHCEVLDTLMPDTAAKRRLATAILDAF